MKVVINKCFGGFGLSDKAIEKYKQLRPYTYDWEIDRADPVLVKIVEELGGEANGKFADLKIVEIPDDVQFQIGYYDGTEWVEETNRKWY